MYQPDQETYYSLDYKEIRSLMRQEFSLTSEQLDIIWSDVENGICCRTLTPEYYDEDDKALIAAFLVGEEEIWSIDWTRLLSELAHRKILPEGKYLCWVF